MFGRAVEVKGCSRLNFEVATNSESLAANLEKIRYDKQFQSSDLFVFFIVLQRLTLVK
jgi:hypothetical protein